MSRTSDLLEVNPSLSGSELGAFSSDDGGEGKSSTSKGKDTACAVCGKPFGRVMKRRHRCRRCERKVCGKHSKERRWIPSQGKLARVCDDCLVTETKVTVRQKLVNLHLKQTRDGYTKIYKYSSKRVEGLIEGAIIVKINNTVVEGHIPQEIADRLNTIKVPYTLTLDCQRIGKRSSKHKRGDSSKISSATSRSPRSRMRVDGGGDDSRDMSPSITKRQDKALRDAWTTDERPAVASEEKEKETVSASTPSFSMTSAMPFPVTQQCSAPNILEGKVVAEHSTSKSDSDVQRLLERASKEDSLTSMTKQSATDSGNEAMMDEPSLSERRRHSLSLKTEHVSLAPPSDARDAKKAIAKRRKMHIDVGSGSVHRRQTSERSLRHQSKQRRRKSSKSRESLTSLTKTKTSSSLRQYCVVFSNRPFGLRLTYCNSGTGHKDSWGWYSMAAHSRVLQHSKLCSVNGVWVHKCTHALVKKLMHSEALPAHLVFEAATAVPLADIPLSDEVVIDDQTGELLSVPHTSAGRSRPMRNVRLSRKMSMASKLVQIAAGENDDDVVIVGTPTAEDYHFADDAFSQLLINGVQKPRNPFARFSLLGFLQRKEAAINWWIADGGWVTLTVFVAGVLNILTTSHQSAGVSRMAQQLFFFALPLIVFVSFVIIRSMPREAVFENGYSWLLDVFTWMRWTFETRSSLPRRLRADAVRKAKRASVGRRENVVVSGSLDSLATVQKHRKRGMDLDSSKRKCSMELVMEGSSESSSKAVLGDVKEEEVWSPKAAARSGLKKTPTGSSDMRVTVGSDEWKQMVRKSATTVWGGYCECTAVECCLRQNNYLSDRIKAPSEEALLKLAAFDVFVCHEDLRHASMHKATWFHRNRHKLPSDLFFLNVHLRLASIGLSIVYYHFLPKGLLHGRGTGFKPMDVSRMFENFVNGECRYRNDRLKLLARKNDGPFYFRIPSNPAIVGRQMALRYYRCYDASRYRIETANSGSKAYEPYDFKTLSLKRETPSESSAKAASKTPPPTASSATFADSCVGDAAPEFESAATASATVDSSSALAYGMDSESETELEDMDALDCSCAPCDCGNCQWIDSKGECPDYLEIEMQPDGHRMANTLINIAYSISKKLSVELHWTLEGQCPEELPERILTSVRFNYIDIDKVESLD